MLTNEQRLADDAATAAANREAFKKFGVQIRQDEAEAKELFWTMRRHQAELYARTREPDMPYADEFAAIIEANEEYFIEYADRLAEANAAMLKAARIFDDIQATRTKTLLAPHVK